MPKRLAGKNQDKLQLLVPVGAKEFPHLVADILFHCKGHTDVKVLDGPGDGKRDIQSVNSSGRQCITQCKFHEDISVSAGTVATDEVAVALLKFGAKHGIFATNAKISPQGKREYLDGFPEVTLSYLEGSDIVDLVLGNPTLSYIWLKNGKITNTGHYLTIPFVIKFAAREPSKISLPKFRFANVTATIRETLVDIESLKPFEAYETEKMRLSFHFFPGYELLLEGAVYTHTLDTFKTTLLKRLARSAAFEDAIVRIGRAYISSEKESHGRERMFLPTDRPATYLLSDRKYTYEQDWFLPSPENTDWHFPKRVSTSEASWAAWYNKELDSCLKLELVIKTDPSYVDRAIERMKRDFVLSSLFIQVAHDKLPLVEKLSPEPNWQCKYGMDGKLFGWLHPYIIDPPMIFSLMNNSIINQSGKEEKNFEKLKNKLLHTFHKLELDIIAPAKVILIAKAEDTPLLHEYEYENFHSAYVLCYFNDLPSPVDRNGRLLEIFTYWEIPADVNEVASKIDRFVRNGKKEYENYEWNTEIGDTIKVPFLKLTIPIANEIELDTDTILKKQLPGIQKELDHIHKLIKAKFPNAKRATQKYYQYEIGILMGE